MKRSLFSLLIISFVALIAFSPPPKAQAQVEYVTVISDTVENDDVVTSSWYTHQSPDLRIWLKSTQANDSIKGDLYVQYGFGSDTLARALLDSVKTAKVARYNLSTAGSMVRFISVGRATGNAAAGTKNTLTLTIDRREYGR